MSFVPRTLGVALIVCTSAAALAQTSRNTTLLAQQDLHAAYAACWGWTSPGGQEFALLGATDGTAIVDVTSPGAPVEKAFIAGVSSSWREMKTWDHYAYIVTEGTGGGMQIVDLASTPPQLVATYTATFTTAHTITIVGGWAYVNGARLNGASVGIRFLDLTDPVHPVDRGGWATYYAHDCQVRGDTLWAACINNDLVAVVDVKVKASPTVLVTFTWPGNNAHNCDLTTDGRYLLTTDEVAGGHLRIFDVGDLGDIHPVAEWSANPAASIHNVHVRGTLAYIAYYTEGLRIVDVADPTAPVEVGYYDTWPGASGGFNGNWEVYPGAASGNAYLSDMTTGLYVVRYAPVEGSVAGTVRETGTGTALPGARVEILGTTSGSSDGRGRFRLFALPGTRTLVTSLFGYAADSSSVVLTVGDITSRDVDLVPLPGRAVGGSVRRTADAAPLAGASVVVEGTPALASADAGGAFVFAHLPYGVYTLVASRFGYAPKRRTVTVAIQDPSAAWPVDFELDPATVAADFEAGPAGWARVTPVNPATSGLWEWNDPVGSGGGAVQPEDDHTASPGVRCWVTGNAFSAADPIGNADVDNGATVLWSPVFDLSQAAAPVLSYWRWFSNNAGANPGSDTLRVDLSNDGGATWHPVERLGQSQATWVEVTVPVASVVAPTAAMRLRFVAEDLGGGSIVEAAVDDVSAWDAVTVASPAPAAPRDRLLPGVPNPFNPATRIRFELAAAGPVTLRVVDARGRNVRRLVSGPLTPGPHERTWDGRDGAGRRVASGSYFVELETGRSRSAERVVLLP